MDEENWNGVPLAAIGSGMVDVNPYPGFASQMDPFERSASTVRRKYGTQVPGPPERATRDEQVMAALGLLPGPPLVRMATAAPKAMTTLGALGSLLYSTDQAGSEEKPKTPKEIMAEQKTLAARNIYKGAIDGKEGPETLAARAEAARQDQEAIDRRVAAEAATATAKTTGAKAEAELAETNRRAKAEETAQANREAGEARMRDIDKNTSPLRKAYNDNAGLIGVGAGLVGGGLARAAIVRSANKSSANRAREASALFDEAVPAGKAGTNARVARTNEFFNQGGAKPGQEPFVSVPGSAKGFAPNPDVAPIGTLYQTPSTAWKDLSAIGAAGLESAAGQFVVGPEWNEQLRQAREAVERDPSEANIDRLQTAKSKAATAELLTNLGRGFVGGYGATWAKTSPKDTRPAMNRAGAEKLDLEDILRKPTRTRTAPTPPENAAAAGAARTRRESRKFTDKGETLADILANDPLGR